MISHTEKHDQFLDALFVGGTSHSSRQEVVSELSAAGQSLKGRAVCTYYQGCGGELVPLICDGAETHVFSDASASCRDQILQSLAQLEDQQLARIIESSVSDWRVQIGGRERRLFFTTDSIEVIDFEGDFGAPLGIVYEYNCGDVAWKRSFWQAIKQKLTPGGQVVGSYVHDFAQAGRTAFVMNPDITPPTLYGCDENDDTDASKRKSALERALQQNSLPLKWLEYRVVDVGAELFQIGWAGRSGYSVTRVWTQPLREFNLEIAALEGDICRLTKTAV